MDIRNETELLQVLMGGVVQQMMSDCAKDIENSMTNTIQSKIYDIRNPAPQIYERTFQLLNSVCDWEIRTIGNKAIVEVFIDADKLESKTTSNKFDSYTSLNGDTSYGGKSISELIVGWYENGLRPKKNSSYIGNQPMGKIGITENASAKFNKNVDKIVRKVFAKHGIEIKKSYILKK